MDLQLTHNQFLVIIVKFDIYFIYFLELTLKLIEDINLNLYIIIL